LERGSTAFAGKQIARVVLPNWTRGDDPVSLTMRRNGDAWLAYLDRTNAWKTPREGLTLELVVLVVQNPLASRPTFVRYTGNVCARRFGLLTLMRWTHFGTLLLSDWGVVHEYSAQCVLLRKYTLPVKDAFNLPDRPSAVVAASYGLIEAYYYNYHNKLVVTISAQDGTVAQRAFKDVNSILMAVERGLDDKTYYISAADRNSTTSDLTTRDKNGTIIDIKRSLPVYGVHASRTGAIVCCGMAPGSMPILLGLARQPSDSVVVTRLECGFACLRNCSKYGYDDRVYMYTYCTLCVFE
jgi:hypothetical protein